MDAQTMNFSSAPGPYRSSDHTLLFRDEELQAVREKHCLFKFWLVIELEVEHKSTASRGD